MSKTKSSDMARLGMYELAAPFMHVPVINGDGFELRLSDKYYYSKIKVPCYEYFIFMEGIKAGVLDIRIESDFAKITDVGNIGVEVYPGFAGMSLPYKATKSVLPFIREHGMTKILITCDKGSKAINKACEELMAQYLDTIQTLDGGEKDRFVFNL